MVIRWPSAFAVAGLLLISLSSCAGNDPAKSALCDPGDRRLTALRGEAALWVPPPGLTFTHQGVDASKLEDVLSHRCNNVRRYFNVEPTSHPAVTLSVLARQLRASGWRGVHVGRAGLSASKEVLPGVVADLEGFVQTSKHTILIVVDIPPASRAPGAG